LGLFGHLAQNARRAITIQICARELQKPASDRSRAAAEVPYRGGGPAMQDMIAGRTDYICTLTPNAKPVMDGNLLKPIAILSRERSPMLPDLPTAHEQGLTDFDTDTWFGLFFPRGTPEPIVRKLNAAIAVAIDTPSVQEQFKDIVANVPPPDRRSPEYLQKLVESEIAKMRAAILGAGIAQNKRSLRPARSRRIA
jgi:tripartite-type tricarboxylate transporter receptor subunit TctC